MSLSSAFHIVRIAVTRESPIRQSAKNGRPNCCNEASGSENVNGRRPLVVPKACAYKKTHKTKSRCCSATVLGRLGDGNTSPCPLGSRRVGRSVACAGEGAMKPFYDYHLCGGVYRLHRRTAHCCLDWDNNQVEGSMSSCRHEEGAATTRSNCLAARTRTAHNSRPIAALDKVFA
jgi:hypothetical protein